MQNRHRSWGVLLVLSAFLAGGIPLTTPATAQELAAALAAENPRDPADSGETSGHIREEDVDETKPGMRETSPEPVETCSLRENPEQPVEGEWLTCLSVAVSVPLAPRVGDTVPIDFDVTSEYARENVTIEAELPGNLRWVEKPEGLATDSMRSRNPEVQGVVERASGSWSFRANETVHYSGKIAATAAGPAQIRVRARVDVAGGVDAAAHSAFLTIGGVGEQSRRGMQIPAELETSLTSETPVEQEEGPVVPEGLSEAASSRSMAAVAGTSCVTGGWNYLDHEGVLRPAINTKVEAVDGNTALASGVTGSDGRYNLCFSNTAAGRNVAVRKYTENSLWRVVRTGTGNVFTFIGAAQSVADGATVDFGNRLPADATLMRGLHAFDSANDAWSWQAGRGQCWASDHNTCRQLTINWAPDSTDGTYYQPADNTVHLAADDPNSPIIVVHEIGHAVMDETYDDNPPASPNCNPHSVWGATSTGCAWSEGFAEWYPASVYNDPFFRWPNGASVDLESATWGTSGWAEEDTVEGRVAGALIDISDSSNETPWDVYGESRPGNIWTTFLNHRSATFAEFWAQRASDGFNTADSGARSSLYQNTIDYDFRNPLADYRQLNRPKPTPHNFSYSTSTYYWSAIAVRPPSGADYDLRLFTDRAQTSTLATSTASSNTVDFVAIDSGWRPFGQVFPRVVNYSGAGSYDVELAQGVLALHQGRAQTVSMSNSDVVAVRDVRLEAGVTYTISATPVNAGQNPELFLMSSDRLTPSTLVKSRAQAARSATAGGPGATETFTYTPSATGFFGVVLVNAAGNGYYTLQLN